MLCLCGETGHRGQKDAPACEVFCFYMDMRMYGPYYEELYRESQEAHNVNYIRGKVSEASVNINNRLVIKVEDTLAGRPLKMELDIMVLMVGMEMSKAGRNLQKLPVSGPELTGSLKPLTTITETI